MRSLCCIHEGVSVLVESRPAGRGAVDVAALKVQVEGTEEDKAVDVVTPLPASSIQGVALHGGTVAVWSASQLEAYVLVRDDASASAAITAVRHLGSLSFPSPPMAVALVGMDGLGQQQQQQQQQAVEEKGTWVQSAAVVMSVAPTATVFVAVDTRIEIHRLRPGHPVASSSSRTNADDNDDGDDDDDALSAHRPSSCLAFSEREGRPTHLDVHGRLLAAATDKGCIKLFDVARHPPRQLGSAGRLALPGDDDDDDDGTMLALRSLHLNADGSWVSLLARRETMGMVEEQKQAEHQDEEEETGLYLYDVDRDALVRCNKFGEDGAPVAAVVAHAWDAWDPRLLACELRVGRSGGVSGSSKGEMKEEEERQPEKAVAREVATLFIAASPDSDEQQQEEEERGILLLDRFPLHPPLHALVGLRVPRLYLTAAAAAAAHRGGALLLRRTMRAFVGLDYDALDEPAQAALRVFHSHLLRGDLPAAYRAGASLRNPLVWENMARLCVRARRLDAAELCLGRMGHARGLRAVRATRHEHDQKEEDDDSSSSGGGKSLVALAMAAVQLGMLDEAARLYHEARRPDLRLRLLVARGHWAEALQLVDKGGGDGDGDGGVCVGPLWRRRVHFEYATHLEALGECDAAARHYEMAGAQQAPRMLLHAHRHDKPQQEQAIAHYVADSTETNAASSSSPALLRWWAGHCEARGRFAEAKAAYRRAGAWSDLVRLACYEGDLAGAEAIVAERVQGSQRGAGQRATGAAAAACFRLAQHLEGQEHDVLRAIEYYAKAGCYNHCVRLARAHELDGEAMAYALKGPASLMRDCARHFERKRQAPRALQLYTKARDWGNALRLCLAAFEEAGGRGEEAKASSSSTSSHHAALPPLLLEAAREIAQGILLSSSSSSSAANTASEATDMAAIASVAEAGVGRLAELLERGGHASEAVRFHLLRLSTSSLSSSSSSLALARRVLRLCRAHEVPLTEGMIDQLLLLLTTTTAITAAAEGNEDEEKEENGNDMGDGRAPSSLLLCEMAEVCAAQGAQASASRLFTQAGDRRRGLQCLLALGDADSVVRYAAAARRPELFLLAARSLHESGAWRRDERARAAVGEFYVRGRAGEAAVRAWEEESGRCTMLMNKV